MFNNIIEENKKRDLYLTDRYNVYYIPYGWIEAFTDEENGLNYMDELETLLPCPEAFCYAAVYTHGNSEVDAMFVPISMLEECYEVTESEAKTIHPKLFDYLEELNKG